jgi:hypothetical protein
MWRSLPDGVFGMDREAMPEYPSTMLDDGGLPATEVYCDLDNVACCGEGETLA